MRIPDLNVSQSVSQRIRELNLERFKLDQQITSGQKITYAEDDGSGMSRTIKLDSQKNKLSQYQRNATYASEFLNTGQLNLEKLREINQRAQEIARLAGGGLNGAAVETYGIELDQLIDETLNRLNSRHRGKALFGGLELKPDFAHSDIKVEEAELKVLDLNQSLIGVSAPGGNRYLKQGDEVALEINGREYVVQAKLPQISEFTVEDEYNAGDLVKVTTLIDDAILVDNAEFQGIGDVFSKLADKDWSNESVGQLPDGSSLVYLLDASQIQQIAVSIGNQPNVDFLPPHGGYYAIVEKDENIFLEPVENKVSTWAPDAKYNNGDLVQWGGEYFRAKSNLEVGDEFSDLNWENVPDTSVSKNFSLTEKMDVTYWEATSDNVKNIVPALNIDLWSPINPNEFVSNVSIQDVTSLLRDLINNDSYFQSESQVIESLDSFAFIRGSNPMRVTSDDELSLSAQINSNGQLEVVGTVGKSFLATAEYVSKFDSNNYFPEQLDTMVIEKAKSLYPSLSYEQLDKNQKDIVWDAVKGDDLHWALSVVDSQTKSGSDISISLSTPWKRLDIYQLGDVVSYNGKLFESINNENFNHIPSKVDSEFWKEIGSDYSQQREDWTVKSTGADARFFFVSPDGKLFSDEEDAVSHSYDILSNSTRNYLSANDLASDARNSVKKIAYPVSRFEALASESNGIVYFDAASQNYKLAALSKGDVKVDGKYIKGDLKSLDDTVGRGDVIHHKGGYYLTLNVWESSDDLNTASVSSVISRADINGDLDSTASVGETIYDKTSRSMYMFIGQSLPIEGRETIMQKGVEQPLRKGSYIYDSDKEKFFLAQENIPDANLVDTEEQYSPLVEVNTFSAIQGSEWSVGEKYSKGQIVFHDGVYYECQTDGTVNSFGEYEGFDNRTDEEFLLNGDYIRKVVSPSDEFFIDVNDTISKETLDLRRARGENIFNNVWLPVSNSVDHVLNFEVNNLDFAEVKIESAGAAGLDAEINAITDINGVLQGLQVAHPGRYFFPGASDGVATSIPDAYQIAEVVLPNGESVTANIIWGQNPNDPGPFVITGFELLGSAVLDKPTGAQKGDTYSFSTGNKTFLDHRDSAGKLISVTYTGSDSDAEFYVGKDSKIGSFLSADNGGTANLKKVLESMIDLRTGLSASDLGEMLSIVEVAERELIDQEDMVVDKIGELSSAMVRINTVRSHDEEYFLEIEQRLAKDLDVDLSEAIMQLTKISTAYQAAMQIGAQLLNTSLLNYL
jgi:flagellin-like hook-associated protein FlgL